MDIERCRCSRAGLFWAIFAVVLIVIFIIITLVLFFGYKNDIESIGVPRSLQTDGAAIFDTLHHNTYLSLSTLSGRAPSAVPPPTPIETTILPSPVLSKIFPLTISNSSTNITGKVLTIRNNTVLHQWPAGSTVGTNFNTYIYIVPASGVIIPNEIYVGPQATLELVATSLNTFIVLTNTTTPAVPYIAT